MIKSFREVSDYKLAIFSDLAAGDCFCFNNTYYMKLIKEYIFDDDGHNFCNSIDLESGALTFFCSGTRVKPYKEYEVILYE